MAIYIERFSYEHRQPLSLSYKYQITRNQLSIVTSNSVTRKGYDR